MEPVNQVCHRLASKAATEFVRSAAGAGLSWQDIAIGGETIVAIVVAACAEMGGSPDNSRFAQEIVDTMTQHAHLRVQALIRGQPYAG